MRDATSGGKLARNVLINSSSSRILDDIGGRNSGLQAELVVSVGTLIVCTGEGPSKVS